MTAFLHFCEKGVKTAAKNYQSDKINIGFSKKTLRPLIWPKQLNARLSNHVPKFISTDFWPATSPDLNQLDYKIEVSFRGHMVCERRHPNLE